MRPVRRRRGRMSSRGRRTGSAAVLSSGLCPSSGCRPVVLAACPGSRLPPGRPCLREGVRQAPVSLLQVLQGQDVGAQTVTRSPSSRPCPSARVAGCCRKRVSASGRRPAVLERRTRSCRLDMTPACLRRRHQPSGVSCNPGSDTERPSVSLLRDCGIRSLILGPTVLLDGFRLSVSTASAWRKVTSGHGRACRASVPYEPTCPVRPETQVAGTVLPFSALAPNAGRWWSGCPIPRSPRGP